MLKRVFQITLIAVLLVAGAGRAMDVSGHDAQQPTEWSSRDDAAFLRAMIVHHRGAVKMAEAVLKTTADDDVRDWANDIMAQQNREIQDMEAMVRELNVPDEGHAAQMEKEMDAMMAQAASSDPDVNFLLQMIPHHAGAIDMALPVLVYSDNKRIRELARDIIEDQSDEICDFREWLDENDG